MALDTRTKRASALGVARPWIRTKEPDITLGTSWRAASGNSYAGYTYFVPSVFLDPTTFTIAGIDGLTYISTNPTTVTVTSMTMAADAYIYKSYGVNAIGDFTLTGTVNLTQAASIGTFNHIFGLMNTPGTMLTQATNNDGLACHTKGTLGNEFFGLYDFETPQWIESASSDAMSVDYYVTWDRSGTTLSVDVKTGSHLGTLVQSESLTVPTTGYEYLCITQSRDIVGSSLISYTLRDMTFSYNPPPPPPSSNYYLGQYQHRFGVMES